jgi:hypothetical protein
MIRPARDLDAGALGAILSDFMEVTDWMPRLHSRAEDISFAAKLIAGHFVFGWGGGSPIGIYRIAPKFNRCALCP